MFFLIGFRNRLVVMIDWAWAYWTHERHARIIVHEHIDEVTANPSAASPGS